MTLYFEIQNNLKCQPLQKLQALNVLHVLHGRIVGLLGLVFQTPKMSCFLYENHRGSPTLTLLNVLGVLGVLNVLNVLKNVLNIPMYPSLACLFGHKASLVGWALAGPSWPLLALVGLSWPYGTQR